MKSLLAGLYLTIALAGGAQAASTDTYIPPIVREVSVQRPPVESKVVEIHMSSREPGMVEEKTRRRAKIATLPLTNATCSGEFIDALGDILTAGHCVDGFDAFQVTTSDQRHYTAIVVATSSVHDLAMLHIDRANTPYFDLADQAVRGQDIFVLGSPLGITNTLSRGVIAKLDGDATLIDCGALPGNSGGPVFDRDENLVGVLNAGLIVMFGVTHLNKAQGLDAVRFFLRDAIEKRYGR